MSRIILSWIHRDVSLQYTVQDYCTLKRTGRTFLLTWKFFTSKIVREFTLQSAPSFGKCLSEWREGGTLP